MPSRPPRLAPAPRRATRPPAPRPSPRSSSARFEQAGRAHATANAHRHDAVAAASAAQAMQERRGELGSRTPQGVTERDRAAIDVQPIIRDAELTPTVDGLGRERLVDLEAVDVFDAEARLRQKLLDRGHGADAHDVWIHTRDREAPQPPDR